MTAGIRDNINAVELVKKGTKESFIPLLSTNVQDLSENFSSEMEIKTQATL